MVDSILNDPKFFIVAIILAFLIGFAVIKKLFKIVLVLLVVFMAYIGYLVYTGEDPDKAIRDTIKEIRDTDLEKVKKEAKKAIDKTAKEIKKRAKKKRETRSMSGQRVPILGSTWNSAAKTGCSKREHSCTTPK